MSTIYRLINTNWKRRNSTSHPNHRRTPVVTLSAKHLAQIRQMGVAELDRKVADLLVTGKVDASRLLANYATLRHLASTTIDDAIDDAMRSSERNHDV
jgi:hypothetical protein